MQSNRRWSSVLGVLGALVVLGLGMPGAAQAHGADHHQPGLTFGIYAGGMAGTPSGLTTGPADDPAAIQFALGRLQGGPDHPFLVRAFTAFVDQPATTVSNTLPKDAGQYAVHGRKVDLVLGYASVNDNLDDWTLWVRTMAHAYGANLGALQITEEPNLLVPTGPNGAERIRRAVVAGVLAADDQLRRDGRRHAVDVGMSAYATNVADDTGFWQDIGRYGTPRFRASLDYVGVDLYPGTLFQSGVSAGTKTALRIVRQHEMPLAHLGRRVPIRVAETGWPTGQGQGRTYAQQVTAVQDSVHAVSDVRAELNVTHYEFFDLRDADSTVDDAWFQFGILRSDYSPKPAFDTFRQLIRELGTQGHGH
jgi:hypothetical protein